MKTKNLKIARRALILAVALFGAASQGNEAEAVCAFETGGKVYRCRGSEGSCHFNLGGGSIDCDGTEIAVLVLTQK